MSNPLLLAKDLYDLTVIVPASAFASATAGGTGDATLVVGTTIDRATLTPFGARGALLNIMPLGAVFTVAYEAVLGAGNTLSISAAKVEDSADGATWATIFDVTGVAASVPVSWPAAGVVDTGAAGGSTQRGIVAYGTDIKKARRYVRFSFTPDLSAANTDTAKFVVGAVLSGIDELPPGVV